eukprot:Sspe_Gene.115863::Locus_104003_Transcript_1_1_Confidence_1.000_Length_471::g.115863::m.115863
MLIRKASLTKCVALKRHWYRLASTTSAKDAEALALLGSKVDCFHNPDDQEGKPKGDPLARVIQYLRKRGLTFREVRHCGPALRVSLLRDIFPNDPLSAAVAESKWNHIEELDIPFTVTVDGRR